MLMHVLHIQYKIHRFSNMVAIAWLGVYFTSKGSPSLKSKDMMRSMSLAGLRAEGYGEFR